VPILDVELVCSSEGEFAQIATAVANVTGEVGLWAGRLGSSAHLCP
jgi:hypothetical protein